MKKELWTNNDRLGARQQQTTSFCEVVEEWKVGRKRMSINPEHILRNQVTGSK